MTHARAGEEHPTVSLDEINAVVERVKELKTALPMPPLRWFLEKGVVTVWDGDDALVMVMNEATWNEMRRLSEAVQ